jgi:transcription-repair coupling factor (superfamily II helicase)
MRDLEIRGAGNLLGPEQSGFLISVGYDMYLKLLEEAVLEERGEAKTKARECSADLTVTANIPEYYVPSVEQRMDLYRRIARIRSEEDGDDLTDELVDRYGDPPRSVNNLISVALLRATALDCGVVELTQRGNTLRLTLDEVHVEAVFALCAEKEYKNRVTFAAGDKPMLTVRLTGKEDILRYTQKFLADYRKRLEEERESGESSQSVHEPKG